MGRPLLLLHYINNSQTATIMPIFRALFPSKDNLLFSFKINQLSQLKNLT